MFDLKKPLFLSQKQKERDAKVDKAVKEQEAIIAASKKMIAATEELIEDQMSAEEFYQKVYAYDYERLKKDRLCATAALLEKRNSNDDFCFAVFETEDENDFDIRCINNKTAISIIIDGLLVQIAHKNKLDYKQAVQISDFVIKEAIRVKQSLNSITEEEASRKQKRFNEFESARNNL